MPVLMLTDKFYHGKFCFHFSHQWHARTYQGYYTRVLMGLTVSRKMVKKLGVGRKNCKKLTVSGKKKLTVKKSSHESKGLKSLIRTFVSLAFYVFLVPRMR